MLHAFGHQLHVSHLPNLTGPFIGDDLKSAANIEAPAGFTERAPTGTIGNPAQQRSKLPDRRVETCALPCGVLMLAEFVASLTGGLKV
jgi:hypothetical protein